MSHQRSWLDKTARLLRGSWVVAGANVSTVGRRQTRVATGGASFAEEIADGAVGRPIGRELLKINQGQPSDRDRD